MWTQNVQSAILIFVSLATSNYIALRDFYIRNIYTFFTQHAYMYFCIKQTYVNVFKDWISIIMLMMSIMMKHSKYLYI